MIKTNAFRLLAVTKDGGEESRVGAFHLLSIKALFSIILLKFEDGSRDAYHSHAFNCLSWVLGPGSLTEHHLAGKIEKHWPSWLPFVTRRSTFHKVVSDGTTYVLTLRGPWANYWQEFTSAKGVRTLTHGRVDITHAAK